MFETGDLFYDRLGYMNENLQTLIRQNEKMLEVMSNMTDKMDMIMGMTEEGRYHNLRTVVNVLSKQLDSIDQKLETLMNPNMNSEFNILYDVLDKLSDIKIRLEELMDRENGEFYNLSDLFMKLKTISEKVEQIEEKI